MDFDLSEEQRLLQDSLARLLADRYGFEQRKEYMKSPGGWSREMWSSYAELGLLGLPFVPMIAPAAWPYAVASGAIHVVYFTLVAAAYRSGDMGLAYPIMRGTAPRAVSGPGKVGGLAGMPLF